MNQDENIGNQQNNQNNNNNNNNINNNNNNNHNNNNNQGTDFTPLIANILPVDNRRRRVVPDNYWDGVEFDLERRRREWREESLTWERRNLHRLINHRHRRVELTFPTEGQITSQQRHDEERGSQGLFDRDQVGSDEDEYIEGDSNYCLNIRVNARDFPVFRIYNSTTHHWDSFAYPDPCDERIPEESRVVLRALFQSFLINHRIDNP